MGSVFGSVLSKAVGDSCVYFLESKQSQLARIKTILIGQPIIDHEVAKKWVVIYEFIFLLFSWCTRDIDSVRRRRHSPPSKGPAEASQKPAV
jgi:hypothetical protein